MSFLIRETHQFILNGRAVTRADAFYNTGIHAGSVYVFLNDTVSFRLCIDQMTYDRILNDLVFLGLPAEVIEFLASRLNRSFGKINGIAIDPGWRSCLQAECSEAAVSQ